MNKKKILIYHINNNQVNSGNKLNQLLIKMNRISPQIKIRKTIHQIKFNPTNKVKPIK